MILIRIGFSIKTAYSNTPEVSDINTEKGLNQNDGVNWESTFGSEGLEYYNFNSVWQTTDGGYIITGSITTSVETWGVSYPKVCILKIDADGNELWSKTFGGGDNDFGKSVRQTTDEGYVIAGETKSFNENNNSQAYLIYYNPQYDTQHENGSGGTDNGGSGGNNNNGGGGGGACFITTAACGKHLAD